MQTVPTSPSLLLLLRRNWWLWAGLVVLSVLLGLFAWFRYSLAQELTRHLAHIKAAGQPVTLEQLDKWHGWVPAEQNAALHFMEAAYSLIPPDSVSPDLAALVRPNSAVSRAPLASELRPVLSQFISNNFDSLQMIRRGASLTNSRYAVNWSNGYGALLPHLAKAKGLAQLLRLEVIFHAEEARPELAVRSLQDLFGLSHSLISEPLVISQLVRNACIGIGCNALEWLLTEHALSEEQIAILGEGFRRAEMETSMARALIGERCIGIDVFEMSTRGLVQFLQSTSSPLQSNLTAMFLGLRNISGLRDRDFLLYLDLMDGYVNASTAPFPQQLQRAKEIGSQMETQLRDHKFLFLSRMLLPSLHDALLKDAETIARLRLAQTALATEQYRLQNHNRLPEGLEKLSAAWTNSLTDPFSGHLFQFRRLEKGYLIYSIGKDARDDGGPMKPRENKSGSVKGTQSDDITFRVER